MAISGCLGGDQEKPAEDTSQPKIAEENLTKNQNTEWVSFILGASPYLAKDMNEIASSSESYDIPAVNEAANNLKSHSDTVLGFSRSYTVSPKLQDAKNNFEASLEAFSTAAKYASDGAEKSYSNANEAKNDFETAKRYLEQGNIYFNKATEEILKFTPWRLVTLDVGHGIRVVGKDSFSDDVTDSLGNNLSGLYKAKYSSSLDTSQTGIVLQKVNVDVWNTKGIESLGFVKIKITTFRNDSLIPTDLERATLISVNEITQDSKEEGTYESNLASGQRVTIYQITSPTKGFYQGSEDVFGFMPDSNTIVTVEVSSSKEVKDKSIKTLSIGPMPSIE